MYQEQKLDGVQHQLQAKRGGNCQKTVKAFLCGQKVGRPALVETAKLQSSSPDQEWTLVPSGILGTWLSGLDGPLDLYPNDRHIGSCQAFRLGLKMKM